MSDGLPKRPWLRWLSRGFVLVGIGWLGWLIVRDGSTLVSQLRWQSLGWLLLSLLVGAVAIAHDALIFHNLIDRPTRQKLGWLYIVRLHVMGQMIRHLPGRFWGVAYQVNDARHLLPPIQTVAINIDFMLVGIAHSMLIPAAFFVTIQQNILVGVLLLVAGLAGLGLILRLRWVEWLLPWLSQSLADKVAPLRQSQRHEWSDIARILALVVTHWFTYLLAWQLFPRILAPLQESNMLLLCIAYSIAWTVGFLSMITPSGLGVREATFVLMTSTLATQSTLALLALFVRLWLLVIDLLLVVGVWAVGWLFNRNEEGEVEV